MPYIVRKGKKGQKPYVIVNQKSGAVVGQSDDLDRANRSITYREEAEEKKRQSKRKPSPKRA